MEKKLRTLGIVFVLLAPSAATAESVDPIAGRDVSLNGAWEVGLEQDYAQTAAVPGLVQDPTQPSPGTLWYRRTVALPGGDWKTATLTLNGARFAPRVLVDGEQVSASEGGMAPTVHVLRSAAVAPGRSVQLEIALKSLNDLDPLDASATPPPDRWRSNVSSGLWDSVTLHLSGATRIVRMTPWTDFRQRQVDVHWELDAPAEASRRRSVRAAVLDRDGREIATSALVDATAAVGTALVELRDACRPWEPESPQLYRLSLIVSEAGRIQDRRESSWGLRDFRTEGLRFTLNGLPVTLRAGTVVWPRFLCDPEARTLAFDPAWFEQNIFNRLRALGANTVRFHLGLPPEEFLDQCDRLGLMVQLEWSFFHGITASPASMRAQWKSWLDVAMRHPSVVLLHPWNETDGEQLEKARAALAAITPDFPPLVVSHRDVLHIHKYWWSLFENVGLYYDSPDEFALPIMVDEFGGNYLDGAGECGGYPTVREAFLRFLGRDHTREQRLRHQAESNALVAEYWRRLGAAGFSPFCILGGPKDGNHWFLGPLREARPKPVWAALSAAFAPESVSLAVWNRNCTPGQTIEVPVHFFNDRSHDRSLEAVVRIRADDGSERIFSTQTVAVPVAACGTATRTVRLVMPDTAGDWRLEAELTTPVAGIAAPVRSTWRCRTLAAVPPAGMRGLTVGVPAEEAELRRLFAKHGVRIVEPTDPAARTLVFSLPSWSRIVQSPELRAQLAAAVDRGQSVVLLDIGPRDLERYQEIFRRDLQGVPPARKLPPASYSLFSGIEIAFPEAAEPESHIHPSSASDALWTSLPREANWLWNGLRGGLVVPPFEMVVSGLSAPALLAQWTERGADATQITGGACYAYELAGDFAFSAQANDDAVIAALRAKVKFLAEDAPSLQGRIDPNGRVAVTDLARAWRETASTSQASGLVPLANAGRNLTRVPAFVVNFGPGRGRVVLSQLLTAGRLVAGVHPLKLYELGHDPAAEQVVLNLVMVAGSGP